MCFNSCDYTRITLPEFWTCWFLRIYSSVDSTPRVPPNTSLKKWLSFLMDFRPNRLMHEAFRETLRDNQQKVNQLDILH